MQPPTEPDPHVATGWQLHGDEAELYRRHHRALEHALARAVNANRALIEDACQTAWAQLLRHQPNRHSVFVWLYVVARHEAYRLVAIERRDVSLHEVVEDLESAALVPDRPSLEARLEALEALHTLANLPETQRRDLALVIAGFTHREIAEITGGRACTNVHKHLVKARARIRKYQSHTTTADFGP